MNLDVLAVYLINYVGSFYLWRFLPKGVIFFAFREVVIFSGISLIHIWFVGLSSCALRPKETLIMDSVGPYSEYISSGRILVVVCLH